MVTRALIAASALLVAGCDVVLGLEQARGTAECPEKGLQCKGNQPQECNSDWRWVDGDACDQKHEVCKGGECFAVAKIAAGANHTCAVLDGGWLRCWGSNNFGQLGVSPDKVPFSPTPRPLDLGGPVLSVSLGGNDSTFADTCAIVGTWDGPRDQTKGQVKCWGSKKVPLPGDGDAGNDKSYDPKPTEVPGLINATSLSLGGTRRCVVSEGGVLTCWNADELANNPPVPEEVSAVTVGGSHACALGVSGSVYCWGGNNYGQCGQVPPTGLKDPTLVQGLKATKIAAGYYHTCAILENGSLACWGRSDCAQLGDGDFCSDSGGRCELEKSCMSHTPKITAPIEGTGITDIVLGAQHTCVRGSYGGVYCWGRNDFLQAGSPFGVITDKGAAFVPNPISVHLPSTSISSGSYHVCATTEHGTRCWGRNEFGQLGNGSTEIGLPGAVAW